MVIDLHLDSLLTPAQKKVYRKIMEQGESEQDPAPQTPDEIDTKESNLR